MSGAQAVALLGLTVLGLFVVAYGLDHLIPVKKTPRGTRQA
jgi:hypothetical protein